MANEGTDNYQPDPKKEELFEELSRRYEREKQNREKHVIDLELTPELEQAGIVERFAFYADTNAIYILLNHQYTHKSIVFSIDKKDWNKTHSIFEKQLKQKGISKEHILQLSDVLDNNHEVILSLRDGGEEQQQQQQQEQEKENDEDNDKQKHKRRYATYKYSAKGNDTLHEAILLAGQPVFIIYDNKDNHRIKAVPIVEEPTRILKPPNSEEYPYEPYEFANADEVRSYMDRAASESIDSLYQRAKSIVRKYNDQDEHKLTLLAADIIWSYFQDKFSTTHYVAIVGGNGSGKTTIGDTFAAVGYRTVIMTDPSAANIFRVLGRIEYGQCTIVMDEAEKIDRSPDTMNVLKSGYQFNARISKINMNEEVQQWFYPYCIKFIIAERSPSQSDAKGVLDRTFLYTAYKGKPQYDIKEILNPAGNEQRQELLDELVDFRKLMLVCRLIHFHDPISDIDIGLDGRDKELCKPLLQLFNETESYVQIKWALQKFLDAKNQKKGNLIEAALQPIIVNLVSSNGKEVYASHIWGEITSGGTIEGYYDEKKPNGYQSADHGTLYRNTITNIICDKFGAEKRRSMNGSILKFDAEKLAKAGNIYNIESKIQTKLLEHDGYDGYDGSTEAKISAKHNRHVKNVNNHTDTHEKSSDVTINATNNTTQNASKQALASEEPSEPSCRHNSDVEDNKAESRSTQLKKHKSYWSSGKWHCSNCKVSGDKFHMQNTPCKGNKKAKR